MSFTAWLVKSGVIDGPAGLGRLSKEWRGRGCFGNNNRNLSFENFLKRRYPEDWAAYRTYHRLIGE